MLNSSLNDHVNALQQSVGKKKGLSDITYIIFTWKIGRQNFHEIPGKLKWPDKSTTSYAMLDFEK